MGLDPLLSWGCYRPLTQENLLIPIGWETIGKTVLEASQWLQRKSRWWEEAQAQARSNAQRQPPGPDIDRLTGTGHYSTVAQQAGMTDLAPNQVKALFLRAWMKTEVPGKSAPSFVKTQQGPAEPHTDFLARLKTALFRGLGDTEAARVLLQVLAFENANPDCQRVLRPPRKANGSSLDNEYIRACALCRRAA